MPADGTGFVPERAPCGGRAGRNALEQMAISHVQLEDMAVLLPWSNGNFTPVPSCQLLSCMSRSSDASLPGLRIFSWLKLSLAIKKS